MGLFRKAGRSTAAPVVQIRSEDRHPFGALREYVPLNGGEMALYRAIREAVPVLDAAIRKLVRLCGGLTVRCGDPAAERGLREFLRTVDVGRGQRGIQNFLDAYLDSLLVCGRAVGEMVCSPGGGEIAALLCGRAEDVEIREGEHPLDFVLCRPAGLGQAEPLPYQQLLLFTPFHPEANAPYGVSLFRSMPFLAEILLKIFQATGKNWERMGNARFAVVYRPQGDVLDRAYARERGEQIAREWAGAMEAAKGGSVRDFVAVGDVDIKVIGADNQILDSQVPVRQILEQLVSVTGIPPFLLGLSWSSTERMSAQQADLMTSEITAIRRTLEPVVEKICRMWLRIHGYGCGVEVLWDDINLQDQVEEARAALYREQARKLKLENDDVEGKRCRS